MIVVGVLWSLPIVALVAYVAHETRVYRRECRAERAAFEEHIAQVNLGYHARPDHPWRDYPFNQQRPAVVEPAGSLGEREFDGASDSTG